MSFSAANFSAPNFNPTWRAKKSAAFSLAESTGKSAEDIVLWGTPRRIYRNANLSLYSGQICNARCAFCVEELRPASRGTQLATQKLTEPDDERYFAALEETLSALQPVEPSLSMTGGEPSKDPRLIRTLRTVKKHAMRKRTLTTNASGLLDERDKALVAEHLVDNKLQFLNISRAHPDHDRNAQLMSYSEGLKLPDLRRAIAIAQNGGVRVRLSCVLVNGAIDSLAGITAYLDFAQSLGVDNVIFRQLMQTPKDVLPNHVVRFGDSRRTQLEPLLAQISNDARFSFVKQIVGYYYYVEVWRAAGMDVVFEEANLATLEQRKRESAVIHELVFHPNGKLASTWQPWDGVLGP